MSRHCNGNHKYCNGDCRHTKNINELAWMVGLLKHSSIACRFRAKWDARQLSTDEFTMIAHFFHSVLVGEFREQTLTWAAVVTETPHNTFVFPMDNHGFLQSFSDVIQTWQIVAKIVGKNKNQKIILMFQFYMTPFFDLQARATSEIAVASLRDLENR